MDLIFGKGNKDISEMQAYFAQIPGTIEIEEMRTDVLIAQEELERYVSRDVVAQAVEHYHSSNFEIKLQTDPEQSGEPMPEHSQEELNTYAILDELVYHTQLAVCFMAYREFALNNDATHTKTGRMARMDRDQDQWTDKLIDRDDMALRRKAQKAIDRLIRFIDKNQLQSWILSDVYASIRDLVIWNYEKFERFYPIETSGRLFTLISPMIRSAQSDYILPSLGYERMQMLLQRIKADNIDGYPANTEPEAEALPSMRELYDKTGSALAYLSIAAAYRELPVQLFPESMSRQFWNAGNGLAFTGLRDKIIDQLNKEGLRKLDILLRYIEKLDADEQQKPITDDIITTIPERMKADNKFVRV